ncbi:hypothetical protein D9757_006323 [Collybiopsis confluens]|uniref:G-patch domain-containing protein n=1 Tax=Collybiopsis confluens TaxID=2823264 RepID=A0A8H5M6U7_9AGAR|nr:hypothetical protein D9757_006323 [Collybiopsis confluens]
MSTLSASTIARWNSIILDSSQAHPASKRKRDDVDDEEDNISIVSRSPSPQPDSMDVDEGNIIKYDEYLHQPAREVVTVETPIKSTNKGFAMLAKLGWVEGQPLDNSASAGRVDPIPFQMKADSTGLGKSRQDVEMIETTVSQRRELDSERQQKETEEQKRRREDAVARKTAVAEEISDTLKAFYCSLCEKQFKNVAQYDEHTNSYAHHHKARFKDMQANIRIKPQDEIDKRKEKERKREEKELRKMAAASGVKMAKLTPQHNATPAPIAAESSTGIKSSWTAVAGSASGSSGAGWAAVGATASPQDPPVPDSGGSNDDFRKSGWATAGPMTATVASTQPSSGNQREVEAKYRMLVSSDPAQSTTFQSGVPSVPSLPESAVASVAAESSQPPPPPHLSSKSHLSRVGWQQFQKKNARKH